MPNRLLGRLRRAEAAVLTRQWDLMELSNSELDVLEGYLQRVMEVGPCEALAEMSKIQRQEFENLPTTKSQWVWKRASR